MKLSLVLRQVRSSLRHLFWSHVLTSGTMAMTFFVFGAFMLVQVNLERLLKTWGEEIQVTAYMNNKIDAAEVQELLQHIAAWPEVARVRHISQEQAWRDFQTALGSQAGLLDGLPRDVLPASVEITLKPGSRDAPVVEQIAERLRAEKGIASVEYPQEWVERMGLAVLAVEWGKWIVGGILFMATFFIVGSTVKLALFARKDEVEIMQLVGASEALIQAPFVIEGMIQGFAGAAISLAALWAAYLLLREQTPSMGGFLAPLGQLQFLDAARMVLLVTSGWLLGAAGSLFSLRRIVKTWYASTAKY
ncbi:MAG TPA: ABC transporter permease [Candidatus Binatia bacterium]